MARSKGFGSTHFSFLFDFPRQLFRGNQTAATRKANTKRNLLVLYLTMVRKGKDKKRRAGRYGKVKQKNKNHIRWDPNIKVSRLAKKHWDPSKSASANLANMGLSADVNKTDPTPKNAQTIELFHVPDSDNLEKKERPLSVDDQKYIAKCLKKHGDNYTKMFRDTKTNDMQHTENVLKKMASRFFLLDPQQRQVEVPKKAKHLVASTDDGGQ